MMSESSLLRVDNLRYSYGSRAAVQGVTFEIRRGEIFGFLGPNGAGKSTTIHCLCGTRSGYEGEITFNGDPFRPSQSAQDRKRIGFVPQDIALYEELTAEENLTFFAQLYSLTKQETPQAVNRALELSGLKERAADRVKTFSGGMKRRLNLAVGDLAEPELLLLDEPTAGVDPQSRNHVFETLESLAKTGRTLLYTTHYMEEVERLCHRIAILDQGRIIDVGTTEELAERAGCAGENLEHVFLQLTGRSLRD